MAALIDQLRQLRIDLQALVDADEEQEVLPPALSLVDAVLSEARAALPSGSTLGEQVIELISAETVESGQSLRAAEMLVITGQLLAVLERQEAERTSIGIRHRDQDLETWIQLQAALPRDGVIRFLQNHPWEYSFSHTDISGLDDYRSTGGMPDRVFFIAELEDHRQSLLRAIATLLDFINPRLGEYSSSDTYRLHAGADMDWATPENEYVFKDVQTASDYSENVVRAYDLLWASARRHLQV